MATETTQTAVARRYPREPMRFNRKCKCGAKHSRLIVAELQTWTGRDYSRAFEAASGEILPAARNGAYAAALDCACGARPLLTPVRGSCNTKIKCDARCMGATGHDCECACGGRNHGASHG